MKSFLSYDAISNADLILVVGAGMKASGCFFDVPLVFCHKRDSDVFIKVKLVHRGTYVKTFKGEIIQCSVEARLEECSTFPIHYT